MGLGAYPASDKQWLGMLGMHGTYESNMAMHDCDVMVAIGVRLDDRITGRLEAFSPNSKKIHIDIDPSSINKNVHAQYPIIGDIAYVLEDLLQSWRETAPQPDRVALRGWWKQIDQWRGEKAPQYRPSSDFIIPHKAVGRLFSLTQNRDHYITTEGGQHQLWAAPVLRLHEAKPRV